MNHTPIALGITAGLAIGVVVLRTSEVRKVERAKRAEIERNKNLDLQAIENASKALQERLNDPTYIRRGFEYFVDDMRTEFALQKIAIRL